MSEQKETDFLEKESPDNPPKDERETAFGLTDEKIHEIEEALRSGYEEVLVETISGLGAADAAELLAKVSEEDRIRLIDEHAPAFDPEVFTELDSDLARGTLARLPANQVAAIISELETDDAITIIQNLDPAFQHEIIHNLSAKLRVTLEEGLNFPEDSAGRLMQREFVAIPQFWTVGKTIDYLRAAADELPEYFFDLFVISPAYHIVGEVPLSRLICSRRSVKLEELALEETHPIPASMDQEHVAELFRREDLTSAPVVDTEGRLIGVITIDDIVDVIDEEYQEDMLRLGGVERSDLYRAAFSTARSRSYWLLVNSFTAVMAAGVISIFDASIDKIVALAILMPIVASMGGNAGTQALAVAVRALGRREISGANAMRLIFKEAIVGLLNGSAFAILIGMVAGLWFSSVPLGLVIGTALVINLFVAGMCGAGIPILLNRLGADPAVSSSVFLTTITDVVGFFAFLGLATIFLL